GAFLMGVGPARFSLDGQRVVAMDWAANAPAGGVAYATWETATGRELARCHEPSAINILALTPDRTGLIAQVTRGSSYPATTGLEYSCWDIADGHERWSLRDMTHVRTPVAGGRRLVMGIDNPTIGKHEAVTLDADDGTVVKRVELG